MSLSGITSHSSSIRLRGGDVQTCADSSRQGRRDQLSDVDPAKIPAGIAASIRDIPRKETGGSGRDPSSVGRNEEIIQAAAPRTSAKAELFTATASVRRRAEQNRREDPNSSFWAGRNEQNRRRWTETPTGLLRRRTPAASAPLRPDKSC